MPIVRIGAKLVYFAHVPRSAGSAIENYLVARFGPLGFLDRNYVSYPALQPWNVSSPQHIDVEAFDRLLPPSFFAARFAVVRHPIDRLISVFRFQRDIHNMIDSEQTFGAWLDRLPKLLQSDPYCFDNHVRPMAEIVPKNARVFRLEDGTTPVVAWLDDIAGFPGEPRKILPANTYEQRLVELKKEAGSVPEVSDADRVKIRTYYRIDFERFGYDEKAPQHPVPPVVPADR